MGNFKLIQEDHIIYVVIRKLFLVVFQAGISLIYFV